LSDETENVEEETEPASVDTGGGAEGEVFNVISLDFPSSTEADMGVTNRSPTPR
jgi:hypothetical protein